MRDTTCVYRAASVSQADLVVIWLAEHGIEAFVRDPLAAVTMPTPLIVAPRGIEVCVADPAQAEHASALVREHFESIARRKSAGFSDQPVQARCEDCGALTEFSAAQRGTVQACSHCGASLDVPAAEEAAGDQADWRD